MSSIDELNETAMRIKVSYQKANNYYKSLAALIFDAKRKIDSGVYGPEWTFDKWLFQKCNMLKNQTMRRMQLFANVIATEERERITSETARINAEKREAKEHAKKKREEEREAKRAAKAKAKADKEARKNALVITTKKKRKVATDKRYLEKKKALLALGPPNALPRLVVEIQTGQAQANKGRDGWIAGTMKVAIAMAKARDQFPSNNKFGEWLTSNSINYEAHERTALIGMGRNPDQALEMLRGTKRQSVRLIWPEIEARYGNAAITEIDNPTKSIN